MKLFLNSTCLRAACVYEISKELWWQIFLKEIIIIIKKSESRQFRSFSEQEEKNKHEKTHQFCIHSQKKKNLFDIR